MLVVQIREIVSHTRNSLLNRGKADTVANRLQFLMDLAEEIRHQEPFPGQDEYLRACGVEISAIIDYIDWNSVDA